MCGIAGAYSLRRSNNEVSTLVNDILHHQRFRGPDFTATENFSFFDRQLILGHNRLSIIDLSDAANQPFYDSSMQWCIIFNGEIYNYIEIRRELVAIGYSFTTQSDTEVLLAAFKEWGLKAVNRFNGMFAIAILDIKSNKLFLIRDRFGVKPLYYYFDGHTLLFASTCSVMARFVQSKPNLNYLSRGLSKWIFESNDDVTPFERIKSVKPGHCLQFDLHPSELSINETRYYDLLEQVRRKRNEIQGLQDSEAIDLLSSTFKSAIKLRLRSDVKVGISLSGGIDSSTVAAFVSAEVKNMVGINYGSPTVTMSEGPLVSQLCKELGINSVFVWPSVSELRTAFWESFEAQESPIYGLSYLAEYMVYKKANELGIKVMLGGQGGDESFMGYRKYLFYYYKDLLRKREYRKANQVLVWISCNLYNQMGHFRGYAQSIKRYISSRGIKSNLLLPRSEFNLNLSSKSELWERQAIDVMVSSIPTQLKSEDRNSMRNSVETRLPFLDYNVVELGIALKPDLKIRDGYSKWIVREIGKNKVPDPIRLARFKRGFDVQQNLIEGTLGREIWEILHDNFDKIKDFVSSRKSLKIYTPQNINTNNLLFQEAMTLLWLTKNL